MPELTPRRKFTEAVLKNDLDMVKQLVWDKKVKPEGYNNSAITEAAKKGHADMVAFLLKQPHVDQSACNFYCLNRSINNQDYKMMEILLNDVHTDFSKNDYAVNKISNLPHSHQKNYSHKTFQLFMKNKYFREALKNKYFTIYNLFITEEVKDKVSNFE